MPIIYRNIKKYRKESGYELKMQLKYQICRMIIREELNRKMMSKNLLIKIIDKIWYTI